MPSDLDTLPVPLYHSGAGTLDATCLAASADVVVEGPPPQGGGVPFALRNPLRTWDVAPGGWVLQRCVGISLSVAAWVIMLAGLAHLCVAALHNRQGELGLGLDATIRGAKVCGVSVALGAVGVTLWVLAELRLRRRASAQPARDAG